jgi:hypothetical protein
LGNSGFTHAQVWYRGVEYLFSNGVVSDRSKELACEHSHLNECTILGGQAGAAALQQTSRVRIDQKPIIFILTDNIVQGLLDSPQVACHFLCSVSTGEDVGKGPISPGSADSRAVGQPLSRKLAKVQ